MLTLVPSYGRDYKSAREVKAAWAGGADFTIANLFSPDDGRQINRQDATEGERYAIRYRGLQSIVIVSKTTEAAPPTKPRAPRALRPVCAEHFCTTTTRNKSGFCTRHNSAVWRRIRKGRTGDISPWDMLRPAPDDK